MPAWEQAGIFLFGEFLWPAPPLSFNPALRIVMGKERTNFFREFSKAVKWFDCVTAFRYNKKEDSAVFDTW